MKVEFLVTDHGLQVDRRNIMPGSTLILGSQPPSHWQRFGTTNGPTKTLTVATPKKRGRPAKGETDEASEE